MTNPEQTLREMLADAIGGSVVGYTETALQHETLTDSATDAALGAVREWLESEAALTIAADAIDEHEAWEVSMKDRGVVVGTDLLPSAVLKALTNSLGDSHG